MSLLSSLCLFTVGFNIVKGAFTQIGNIVIDNADDVGSNSDVTIIDDTLIIEFSDQCYTGQTPQVKYIHIYILIYFAIKI